MTPDNYTKHDIPAREIRDGDYVMVLSFGLCRVWSVIRNRITHECLIMAEHVDGRVVPDDEVIQVYRRK